MYEYDAMKTTEILQAMVIKLIMIFPKILSFFVLGIAIAAGIVLSLVLSKDIDKDGYIKITRGVIIRFFLAVCFSIFVGSLIIDVWHLQYLGILSQGCIFFLTAVFGLLVVGIFYQSIELMRGEPLGKVIAEVMSAFVAIFKKGV